MNWWHIAVFVMWFLFWIRLGRIGLDIRSLLSISVVTDSERMWQEFEEQEIEEQA